MALGKKKEAKKGSKKGKSDSANWRVLGSVWENEHKGDTFFSISFNNLGEGEAPTDYVKGRLIWHDEVENKYYTVKGANMIEPKNPIKSKNGEVSHNISINLDNDDYHAEFFGDADD